MACKKNARPIRTSAGAVSYQRPGTLLHPAGNALFRPVKKPCLPGFPGNRGFLFLHALVERPLDDLQLLLSAETAEVHGVAGNTNGQSRIFFRMLHGVDEELPVHDVDV